MVFVVVYTTKYGRLNVAISQVYYVMSPDFCGEYQNYTFLETLLYKQSEN